MNKKLFTKIVELVSNLTSVEEHEIFNRSRKKALVDARYLIIYIARQLEIKPVYIQRYFTLRGFELHYTTLFHAINRIDKDMKTDLEVREIVDSVILQFNPTKVINTEYINQ